MAVRTTFATEQWLPFPRALVFAFFANPRNLPPLMPDWQRARIEQATLFPPPARPEGSPSYPGLAAGDGTELLITAWALPWLPLRGRWLARIEDFRWNEGFCDVQLKGPFAYWRHCHSVTDATHEGRMGTIIHDQVTYQLPVAPLSRPALPIARWALAATFRYRQRQAAKLVKQFAEQVSEGILAQH